MAASELPIHWNKNQNIGFDTHKLLFLKSDTGVRSFSVTRTREKKWSGLSEAALLATGSANNLMWYKWAAPSLQGAPASHCNGEIGESQPSGGIVLYLNYCSLAALRKETRHAPFFPHHTLRDTPQTHSDRRHHLHYSLSQFDRHFTLPPSRYAVIRCTAPARSNPLHRPRTQPSAAPPLVIRD